MRYLIGRSKRRCEDCGRSPMRRGHDYMLDDAIWRQAGYGEWDIACVECLVARLGRPLRYSDFTDCPMNDFNLGINGYRQHRAFVSLMKRGFLVDDRNAEKVCA
jgi:hypothetical protein